MLPVVSTCYRVSTTSGGELSPSSSQEEEVNPAGAEIECGAGVWPRPWYRPLEEGEEGIDVAATETGSWEVAVRRPVCSVCSG